MLKTGDEKAKTEKDEEKKEDKKEISVKIDLEGINQRILAIDIPGRNYTGLVAGPKNTVFIMEAVPNQSGLSLHKYDIKEQEKKEFMSGVQQAVSSHDRKSLLVRTNGSWSIVGTAAKPKNGDGKLKMNVRIKILPQAEYRQIFKEGWRYMRDFLYVENVHGAPWDEVWDWYSPWIEHVRHRTDLNYVLDILSGEVAVGHSYVRGGDMPDVERVGIGLLGADYSLEGGYYQIKKIYTGESWNPSLQGPLAMPGLEVEEGDYILAVNGNAIAQEENIFSLFEETVSRQTSITVNSSPTMEGARQITVKPIGNEFQLRSFDWIEANRRKVDELSGGKLAYVYVPNTAGRGFFLFQPLLFCTTGSKRSSD